MLIAYPSSCAKPKKKKNLFICCDHPSVQTRFGASLNKVWWTVFETRKWTQGEMCWGWLFRRD